MRISACTHREGNPEIQTKLVKALKRDITWHRRHVQDQLASKMATQIRQHRVVDGHFVKHRGHIIQTAISTKQQLDHKHDYYAHRGSLAMDMVYSNISFQLAQLENELRMEVEQLKQQNKRMMDDIRALEHRMVVQKSQCHFFKSLYETEPSKPVGESLEMLRHDDV